MASFLLVNSDAVDDKGLLPPVDISLLIRALASTHT